VLTGSEGQILNLLQLGGNGIVAPTANLAPWLHVGIIEAFRTGDYRAAGDLYRRLAVTLDIYGIPGSFHSVIKEAMVMLDLAAGSTVRSPALPLTPESRGRLREALTRADLMAAVGRE
ncbi:MAG TPA: dihydrodipicolinate synthase family protein, partial [Thermomicrobiales bacterium]|nr:dihydrodipicolinate synthase family protein [Thermomicrobiales bacterium]